MQDRETRRAWLRATGLVLVGTSAGLAGCAGLWGRPQTVDISEERLVEMLGRNFPRSQRHYDLIDVTLQAPQVRLMPSRNRVGTDLAYSLGSSVLSDRQITGTLSLSYGLRFDSSDSTVRLAGVKVEQFELKGLPPSYASRTRRLGAVLAEDLFDDVVLYRLSERDQQQLSARGLRLKTLSVVPGGVRLQLEPVASSASGGQQVR